MDEDGTQKSSILKKDMDLDVEQTVEAGEDISLFLPTLINKNT